LAAGEFKIVVAFHYSTERAELEELAAKANVPLPDLFDWISIIGAPLRGDAEFEIDYECA
jgi:hypothetical protein